jgi:predicted AlkP superfamily phosphohydrolase/phosphomutase
VKEVMFSGKRKTALGVALVALVSLVCMSAVSCGKGDTSVAKKVIVLGIDGMDPVILGKMMEEGVMPNFVKLAGQGSFVPLATSIPPQSPVAWSDFITGMDPGGHGIFDFIHRKPDKYEPYLSTSRTEEADEEDAIKIGDWILPLSGGETILLRKGKAFWQILEEHGIPTTIIKIPANFPPAESKGRSISGMGTPDILGTYGTFSFYTDYPAKYEDEDITGGKIYPVSVYDNLVEAQLVGPRNSFKVDQPSITVDFTICVDPENPVAKIEVQENEILLNVGEWSDWVQVDFEAVPLLQSVSGICRFYLKQIRPDFELYVTPINIDPFDPALPISTPEDYAAELGEALGAYYTQGMPEDTKAFSADVLGVEDYLKQGKIVSTERLAMYDKVLEEFDSGLLFFYFCSLDQNSHMLWFLDDPDHPIYEKELAEKYGDTLREVYLNMDEVVGTLLEKADDDTTLIVMSDHGFAPYYRSFNLGTWLKDNGYVTLTDDTAGEFYMNVDWRRTTAYPLGLNGLYINQRGRERDGIVNAMDKDAILDEIAEKLLELRDPKTGEQAILRFYKTKDIYKNADEQLVPDAIIGYNRGYRASWETAVGSFPKVLFTDNEERWSGDHCMAAEVVPGILVTNKKVKLSSPSLRDMAPTMLAEFGVEALPEMTGKAIF